MQIFRDLSFDFAERVEGDKIAGLDYCISHGKEGEHYHFWVPAELSKAAKGALLERAQDDALNRFKVKSMSWDEKPNLNLR